MISQSISDYYKNRLGEHGSTARGVGWKDKEAQDARFTQLTRIISGTGPFSLNDLGCGTGDLFPFLKSQFDKFTYRGYDVMPEMIVRASSLYKEAAASFTVIRESSEMVLSDFSVASGIFNLKFESSEEAWKDYIIRTLHHMDGKSSKGFAFNALTSYSDPGRMEKELFYADPVWLFDYCKRNFARNVALLHDYSMYDFTILVRKNF